MPREVLCSLTHHLHLTLPECSKYCSTYWGRAACVTSNVCSNITQSSRSTARVSLSKLARYPCSAGISASRLYCAIMSPNSGLPPTRLVSRKPELANCRANASTFSSGSPSQAAIATVLTKTGKWEIQAPARSCSSGAHRYTFKSIACANAVRRWSEE